MRTSNMLVNYSQKPSWHHWEWDWIKMEGKGENLDWKQAVKMHQQKNCKNCTENIPFFDEVAYLQHYKHPNTFHSLPVDKVQKNGRKRGPFEWVLVVFACKRWPKKNCKIWQSTYLWAQKVPTTSQQSTINLALCVVSMVWEKEREKGHFYCFQLQWQLLTHVYHGGFFCWLLQTAFVVLNVMINFLLVPVLYLVP